MNRKPVSKFIAYVTALCTMVVLCGMPAVAFAAGGGVTKEETVYVVTDSSGNQDDVIVSDHLVNKDKDKKIDDETTLTDIENVKGEETFQQKGDALTWDAEGNSIYYQGRTEEEVPVSMDIAYRLNDKVVSGPELQGASGKVEIRINYENNAEFNGTTVPFVVMTGLIVTDDTFKNIKISKGKVIDDGEKLLVVGMAAPGLAQTLGVGESELGFGSSVTITGDADKFAVEDMMTIVTNAFFEDVDTDGIDLNYDDEIKQLDQGAKALVDGSKLLYDGLNAMDGNMPNLKEGIDQLKTGADQLNLGTKNAQAGATQLNTGVQQLGELPVMIQALTEKLGLIKQAATGLETSLTDIKSALVEYKVKLNSAKGTQQDVINYLRALNAIYGTLNEEQKQRIDTLLGDDGIDRMGDVIEEAEEVYGTLDVVANGSKEEGSETPGLTGLADGIGSADKQKTALCYADAIGSGVDEMITTIQDKQESFSGLGDMIAGSEQLKEGLDQLAPGAQGLADGIGGLQEQSGALMDGVKQLDQGSLQLSQGMAKLYKEGIRKIVEMYNDELKGTLDNARSMLDAGKGYKSFTRLPAGMDGNVKFIYKTDMTK